MIGSEHIHIRLLCHKDIETLGNLHFPWSTEEETIAKWTRYLEEQQQGIRKALIVLHQDGVAGIGIGKPKDTQHQRELEIHARRRFYATGGNKEAYLAFLPFDSFPEGLRLCKEK